MRCGGKLRSLQRIPQYSRFDAIPVPTVVHRLARGDALAALWANHHVPIPSLTLADLNTLKDDFVKEIRHASFMGPKESRPESTPAEDLG